MVTSSAMDGSATGELVLRVVAPSREGQIVRLRSYKCSVGAGPRCTLRLRARGLRPVHCLIVRGPRRAIVRRWSPDTLLNGQSFTDAELRTGDRLSMGKVELEVVEPGWMPRPARDLPRIPHVPPPPVASPCPGSTSANPRVSPGADALATRLKQAGQLSRQRLRRLVQQLRQAREELARHDGQQLQQQQRQAERVRLEDELRQRTQELNVEAADLDAQRQALQDETRQWQARQHAADLQLQARAQELEAKLARMRAEQKSLEGQQSHWQQQNAVIERQRVEWQEEQSAWERQRAERQEEQSAWERQRAEWRVEQSTWDRQRAERDRGQGQESLGSEAEALPVEEPPERELEFQAPNAEAPTNLAEVLRRLGANVLPDDDSLGDENEDAALSSEPRPSNACPETAGVASSSGEDDESMDEYTARWLQRLRSVQAESGSRSPSEARAPRLSPKNDAPPEGGTQPAEDESGGASSLESVLRKPQGLTPRGAAPETVSGLAAMRELANLSAQAAIETHWSRQALHKLVGKLVFVLMATAVGSGLLWMHYQFGTGNLNFYGAMIAYLIALIWAMQSCQGLGRVLVRKSRTRRAWLRPAQAATGPACPPRTDATH